MRILVIFVCVVLFSFGAFTLYKAYLEPSATENPEIYKGYSYLPKSQRAFLQFGPKNEVKGQLFQGFVAGYKDYADKSVVLIKIYDEGFNKVKTVEVLINIDESAIPTKLNYRDDLYAKEEISKSYITSVGFYPYLDMATMPEYSKNYFALEKFKETFVEGTGMSFFVLTNYPQENNLTNDYCISIGYYKCVVMDMTRRLSGDMEKFWTFEDYQGILVPFEIYLDLINE